MRPRPRRVGMPARLNGAPSPALGAILGRSMRRRSPWLRCLRSRRPDDPGDGAKGDHFRSSGAGDGAGEGAGASGSFSGRGYPTMAKIVPLCSAGARAVHAALRRRQRLAPGIQARSELRRDAVSMFDLPYRIRCDLRASSRVGWQQTPRPRLRFRLACLIGQGQRPGFSDAAVIGDCRVHGRRFNNLCFCNMASELRANARNAQKTVAKLWCKRYGA
jgi:hypothetical protein